MKAIFDNEFTNILLHTQKTKMELNCPRCNKIFTLTTPRLTNLIYRQNRKSAFCSKQCLYDNNRNGIEMVCNHCSTTIIRTPCTLRSSKSRVFCSKSCAASFNNANKAYGTRRSKLEIFIEKMIQADFPSLEQKPNDRTTIGYELDFYFPQLKHAIEINGIVHYSPIYGEDKFRKIQSIDLIKSEKCISLGISLQILDCSNFKHFTIEKAKPYYDYCKLSIENKIVDGWI